MSWTQEYADAYKEMTGPMGAAAFEAPDPDFVCGHCSKCGGAICNEDFSAGVAAQEGPAGGAGVMGMHHIDCEGLRV